MPLYQPPGQQITVNLSQTISGVATVSAGLSSMSSGELVFSNSNGVSFGMNNGTITASVAGGGGGGAGSYNILAAGTQTANSTGTVAFVNSNNVSFGMSNNSVITASVSYSQSTAPSAISAGTAIATNGTVALANSNGISFGMNAGTITASYTVPNVPVQTNQSIGLYASGNTTGQSSSSTFDARSLSVSGVGIVSVGESGGQLIISATTAQSVQTQNSVQVLGSSGNVSFGNANGVSFGGNASTITASVAAGATATGNLGGISAGTTLATNGTVALSNSNGISFGMNAGTITASYTVPTQSVQTQNSVQVLGSSGNISFGNANGISFGGNGSTITASYTVPTQTNQTQGIYGVGNTAGQSSSSTYDARSLTVSGAGIVSVGNSGGSIIISATTAQSIQTQNSIQVLGSSGNISFANGNGVSFGANASTVTASVAAGATATGNFGGISAGTTQATNNTVILSNSNGISFGMNAGTVTASYTVPTQTNQTEGWYAVGNTTGQSSSSTYDARSITLSAAGIISIGNSGGSVIISASSNQSVQTQNSVQVLGSSGNVSFGNANNVTFGANASTITASIPAGATATGNLGALAAGTQTGSSGTIALVNSNGISFGMSNSSQITASYTVPTQSVQSYNILAAGTQTANTSGTVSFANSNNISFGMSNSSVITASFSYTQSVAPNAISAGTTLASTGTVVFSNSNNVTFGMNNGTITASANAAGVGDGYNIIAAGTQTANTTGTIAFLNSNSISFGMSNSSQITASFSYTQSTAPAAFSAGTTLASNGTVALSNSNGISFGMNAGTITASYTVPNVPAQTNQTLGLYASGNTTGQSSSTTIDARSLTLSAAGNASLGYSNGAIVVSVVAAGAADGVNILAAGTQTATSNGTVAFLNSNNISFGMSNSSQITASFSYTQSTAPSAVSAGTTQATNGTIALSNSNGISFGMNAGTITASYTVPNVPAQTAQTVGYYATGNTTGQSSSSTYDARSITLSAAGIISIGNSGGSLIVSATTSQSVQTQNSVQVLGSSGNISFGNANGVTFGANASTVTASVAAGATATGNFGAIGAGTQTATSGTVTFANSNNITFGMSGSNQITASFSYTQSTAPSAISAGTTQATNNTVVLSNSNGISFGMNAGTITASYTVPTQTNQTVGLYASNNTTGQSSSSTYDARSISFSGAGIISVGNSGGAFQISATQSVQTQNSVQVLGSSGNISFGNANGISFGGNGSTITASYTVPAQTNQTEGFYAAGNTTGQSSSSTFDARSVTIQGAGNVSVGYSGGSIIISATGAGGGGADGVNIIAAGTQTANTTGTVAFLNSNNVSFGMTNSSQVTASFSYSQSTAPSAISAGTTQATNNTVVFSNSNNISFGMNAGTITASVSETPFGISAGTQSISTGTMVFSNSNNVSFGMSGSSRITASFSYTQSTAPSAISAGTTQATNNTVVLSNSNGISFGMNAGTITASYTVPTQSVQTIGLYAGGNTTGQSSSSTFDARTISFSGAGIASVGYSGGSVIISVPAGGGGGDGYNIVQAGTTGTTGSTWSSISATVRLNGSNGIIVSQNNSNDIVIYDNDNLAIVGNTAGAQSTVSANGTFYLSGGPNVTLSQNGQTIAISAGAGGGGGALTLNDHVPYWPASTAGQTLGALNATTASAFVFPISVGAYLNFNAIRMLFSNSYVTSTAAGSQTITSQFGLYSNNASTLSLISSNSFSIAISNSSVSATVSAPLTTATTGYAYNTLTASTTAQIHSLFGTVGFRQFDLQFGNSMSMTPGIYWLAVHQRFSSSSNAIGVSASMVGNVVAAINNVAPFGLATSANTTNFALRDPLYGLGVYTSTGSAGYGGVGIPSASMFLSGIAHTVTLLPLVTILST